MLAGGEQARCLAYGFALAVAGNFSERAIYSADTLVSVGDKHALGGALEDGGGQVQFFLHQLAFGYVPRNRQQARVTRDEKWVRRQFAYPDAAVDIAKSCPETMHNAVLLQLLDKFGALA